MATVLVVDDAAFMRMRAAKLLAEEGYDIIEAGNGVEALKLYQENKPDCVLMDITMPEMDGLTALKEIRKVDPEARIAMVTAMGQQAIILEALKAGAKDFVIKPFEKERVVDAVAKLLASFSVSQPERPQRNRDANQAHHRPDRRRLGVHASHPKA